MDELADVAMPLADVRQARATEVAATAAAKEVFRAYVQTRDALVATVAPARRKELLSGRDAVRKPIGDGTEPDDGPEVARIVHVNIVQALPRFCPDDAAACRRTMSSALTRAACSGAAISQLGIESAECCRSSKPPPRRRTAPVRFDALPAAVSAAEAASCGATPAALLPEADDALRPFAATLPGVVRLDTSKCERRTAYQLQLPRRMLERVLHEEERAGLIGDSDLPAQQDAQHCAATLTEAANACSGLGGREEQATLADKRRLRAPQRHDIDDDVLAWAVKCAGGNRAGREALQQQGFRSLVGKRVDVFLPAFVQWVAAEVLSMSAQRASVRFWCALLSPHACLLGRPRHSP